MKSLACFFIAAGVAAGAFGAHALRGIVTPERLDVFRTGVQYHVAIAIAALCLSTQASVKQRNLLLMLGGIIVFWSLYVLVCLDLPIFGAITPLGGVAIILSLILCGLDLRRDHK
jgi:uncharacterized membrane protein YgdD (TMEM256/DUF423 family)